MQSPFSRTDLTELQQAKLDAQLKAWRDELISLTKHNRALYFRHTKSSTYEIETTSVQTVFERLAAPGCGFFLPEPTEPTEPASHPPKAQLGELVVKDKTTDELNKGLRALDRKVRQMLMDTGLSTLYLGFGMLHWIDPTDKNEHDSPLFLQPVKFSQASPQAPLRLEATEEDAVINPSLTIKMLNDLGVYITVSDDLELNPATVMAAVRKAIKGRPGWRVDERIVLAAFTFHKEVMYRDLIDNAKAVYASGLVQVLGLGSEAPAAREYAFDIPTEATLDITDPPESLVSVRDADATQRACIVSAKNGKTFVMDGPPGTGKSQTITNIIAELLHQGKTVLFVSEKAAALDVVSNRLHAAGLSEFVLELHSHKATRKEVSAELGRSLTKRLNAASRFSPLHHADLADLRRKLNDYAIAINVRREPFDQSLHRALGRVVSLQHLPHAPVSTIGAAELDPVRLSRIIDAAQRLGRAWGPVERGDRFLWRSLVDVDRSMAHQQRLVNLLQTARLGADGLVEGLLEINALIGLAVPETIDQVHQLQRLLSVVELHPDRHTVPATWLTESPIGPIEVLIAERKQAAAHYAQCKSHAESLAGDRWRLAPAERSDGLRKSSAHLATERPALVVPEAADHTWLTGTVATLVDAEGLAATIAADATALSNQFGLAVGRVTPRRCAELVELGSFVGSSTRPEGAWLDPAAQAALMEAESLLSDLVGQYRERRSKARDVFTDNILSVDVVALRARFQQNTGPRKLGATYRADKKLLGSVLVTGKVTPETTRRLDEAVEWKDVSDRLTAAENAHGSSLGRYYADRLTTDFEKLRHALELTRRALHIAGGQLNADLTQKLDCHQPPDNGALLLSQRLGEHLRRWNDDVAPSLKTLTNGEMAGDDVDLHEVVSWAGRCRPAAMHMAEILSATTAATGQSLSVNNALLLMDLATKAAAIEGGLSATAASDSVALGQSYRQLTTDFAVLERNVAWAKLVRAETPSPLHHLVASELLAAPNAAENLRQRTERAEHAWEAVASLFEASWRQHLEADFVVSLQDGIALIEELQSTLGDVDEWVRFCDAQDELETANLGSTITFCRQEVVPAGQISSIVERAVLEGWCDSVIGSDSRLSTLSPKERNNLVEKFRELDRAQVASASSRIINACSDRRPNSQLGEAAVVQRESQKKTRHKPIRQLFAETMGVSRSIKPCLMMSPLTVSQFLPPNMIFDVVIFDEASQVKPADAINCIYRGRQLIVAGDPKQLPPTSFFDQAANEADEYDEESPESFESVLDVCLSGGIARLPLLWHYRSKHESLITYSNRAFYRGKLHTFPSATDVSDDLGVSFIHANGTYGRSTTRDNPIEAKKVVERVLFHRQNNPGLTLGVVAFSSAQEAAISNEIDRQASRHPELAELLTADRLDGFFVKSLENVQGDERDIILFSIGYGPDEHGRFSENLGPLNKQGGERRLNVAVTRARQRLEVVSSVRSGDFTGSSKAAGVHHLKQYLDFAERGIQALALELDPEEHDTESPFEEEVVRVLREAGFTAVPQVGIAGFRIDIGVKHPSRPGEYVLGVECDGAAYHSSRVARDRDRIRQDILENLGWRLYRIWGPSWYRDRKVQEAALLLAIENAVAGRKAEVVKPKGATQPPPEITSSEIAIDDAPTWSQPYTLAQLRTPVHSNNFTQPSSRMLVAILIEGVVAIEGPIHVDLLRRRLLVRGPESLAIGPRPLISTVTQLLLFG